MGEKEEKLQENKELVVNDNEKGEKSVQIQLSFNKKIIPQIVEVIGALFVILGCFLPMYKLELFGINKNICYIEGDGMIVLICMILSVILACMKMQLISLIPILGSMCVTIYTMVSFANLGEISEFASMGGGIVCLVAGHIIALIAIVLAWRYKTDLYSKKKIIISAIAILLLIIIAIALTFVGKIVDKKNTYKEACKLMEKGNYESAIDRFEELGDYEDAADQILECEYLAAVSEMENGFYNDAKDAFAELGKYNDAPELIKKCDYLDAKEEMEWGNYQNAIDILETIADYEDSAALIEECYFELAKSASGWEDLIQVVNDIAKNCPNNQEAQEYARTEIDKELESYEAEEEYEAAIEFLNKLDQSYGYASRIKSYQEKLEQIQKEEAEKVTKDAIYSNYEAQYIDYIDLAGVYYGVLGQTYSEINIYSSPEGSEVGNIDLYLSDTIHERRDYAGNLVEVADNVFQIEGASDEVLLGFTYDYYENCAFFDVYVNGEQVDRLLQIEHWYS